MVSLAARHRQVHTLVFGATSVDVALRQVTNANRISLIKQQMGLNHSEIILEGRMVDPRTVPSTMVAGSIATLVWAGRTGLVRVESYQSVLVDSWRQLYGDRVVFSWRTDEV